ncbi:MAG: hypothetical protein LBR25_00500 [Erysipelotrichaceae bacterium]|jgi:protein involved in sex pheromone biosynthesis|nr:hypothetical protein [Erysipelotrichaceae bacterium]
MRRSVFAAVVLLLLLGGCIRKNDDTKSTANNSSESSEQQKESTVVVPKETQEEQEGEFVIIGGNLLDYMQAGQFVYEYEKTYNMGTGDFASSGMVAMKHGQLYVSNNTFGTDSYTLVLADGVYEVDNQAQSYRKSSYSAKTLLEDYVDFCELSLSAPLESGEEEFNGQLAHYDLYDYNGTDFKIYSLDREILGFQATTSDSVTTIIIKSASYKVLDSLFKIPSGYTQK